MITCILTFLTASQIKIFGTKQYNCLLESELRFSRNDYVIIPFQIEWPDCTLEVSMEIAAFVVFYPV